MTDILSREGSIQYKNLISRATNTLQTTPIQTLKDRVKVMRDKKYMMMNYRGRSAGDKSTIQTYIDELNNVINLTEARINELEHAGGRIKKRKSSKKKSVKRRKTIRKRK